VNLELAPYSTAATVQMTSADFILVTSKEICTWKCRPKQDATGMDIMYLPARCR
jgi:hypothetical protein